MKIRVREVLKVCALLALIAGAIWAFNDTLRELVRGEDRDALVAAALSAQRSSLLTGQKLPVVFVHGINDTGAGWDEMKAQFRALGWNDNLLYANSFSCSGLNEDYATIACSNISNAGEIAGWVNAASTAHGGSQVILVAHSMGGVSARYFMKNNPAATKVAAFISMASMNNGLPLTCPAAGFKILGFDVGATICNELSRTGQFIPTLWKTSYDGIPSVNFYSSGDETVSTYAAMVPGACNVMVDNVGHSNINRSTLKDSDKTGVPGIPEIRPALEAFLKGDPYNTFCEPGLVVPSIPELTTGVKKFLVVPLTFADSSKFDQRTPNQLDAIFGTATQVGPIGRYFREISNGVFQPIFVRSDAVELPGNLFPTPIVTNATFGGIASNGDILTGATVADGTANDVDKALCAVRANGDKINLAEYDGVVFIYQDSAARHRQAQRVNASAFEGWRNGEGLIRGIGNVVPVVWYDCPTGDVKKQQYSRFSVIVTGSTWQSDNDMLSVVAHELLHASGMGHATRSWDEYGNLYDVMGARKFALSLGGLYTGLTDWFGESGNARAIQTSGRYDLNTIESQQYPTALTFAHNGTPGTVALEIHDGTDSSIEIEPREPRRKSGLLAVVTDDTLAFGGPNYKHNRTRLILGEHGLAKGECDVLDLGNRTAIYRYNEDGTVDIKFTDDSDFSDGGFNCGVDLSVDGISIDKAPVVGSQVRVSAVIRNVGDEALSSTYDAVLEFVMPDAASILVGEVTGTMLEVGEEEALTFSWTPTIAGEGSLIVSLVGVAGDEYIKNDFLDKKVVVKPISGQSIPTQPVQQRINFEKTGGGEGAVGISVRSPDGKSHESWSCEIGLEDCSFARSIGSRITLTGHPKDSTAFTGFTGAYCNGLKTCPTFELSGTGTVTLGFVPTAEITLSKDGTGASTGDLALSYLEPGNDTRTECTENCVGKTFTVVAGSQVTATAIPTLDESEFWSWTGCSPTADNKEVCNALAPGIGQSLNINANFKKLVEFRFTRSGEAQGTLTYAVDPPGADNSVEFTKPFESFSEKRPEGTSITLTYVPPADLSDRRVRLYEWGYDASGCSDSNNSCSTTLGTEDERFGITAKYQYKITIGHEGTKGSVSLTSNLNQGGLTCPSSDTSATCRQGWYWSGSDLTIRANPNSGYTFGGWLSGCTTTSDTCTKSPLSGPATVRAKAFPVHYYEFYIVRDCASYDSGRFIHESGNPYCGQGDIYVDFETSPTLFSPWTDYLNQRHQRVPGTDYWQAEGDPDEDSWTSYWRCDVNDPYNCTLEGGGRDTDGDGFITAYVRDADGRSAWSRIDAFFLIYGFRSNYDVALNAPNGAPTFAAGPYSGVRMFRASDEVTNLTQDNVGETTDTRLVLASVGGSGLNTSVFDAFTKNLETSFAALTSLVPYEGDVGSRLALVGNSEAGTVRIQDTLASVSSAWKSYSGAVQSTLARLLPMIGPSNLAAVGDLSDPDLVARRLYVNNCTSECVISPGDSVYLTAIVTNESFVATTNAFGTKLTIHKQEEESVNDLVLYRYSWDGVGAQSAAIAEWAFDWIPDVGTYDLNLAVDDWNNIDPNNANDTLTMTVTVSDQPVVVNTGVRDAFGGSVQVRGDAVENITCTTASCSASPTLGSTVELVATANENRELVKWEGDRAADCIITNFATSTCKLRMVNAKDVRAYFETVGPELTLAVDTQGGGSGKVSSTNTGGARDFVNCSDTCVRPFVSRSTVILTATPASGSYFSEWGGADAERCAISAGGRVCTITVKKDEASEIRPLFIKGTVPRQDVIIRTYSDSENQIGGSAQIIDPNNGDEVLHTCSDSVCTYTLDAPQASGRPLKVMQIPSGGFSFSKYVSPVVDLTPDGRFDETGCGPFDDSIRRITDSDETTWYTCNGRGRIVYSSHGNQQIKKIEMYLPSVSRAIDAGAYEKTIKKAVGDWGGLSPTDPSLQYNDGNISRIVDDILDFRYTSSNNKLLIVRTGALPRRPGINQANIAMYTSAPGDTDLSVDGRLDIDVRSGTTPDTVVSIDLPGPAYEDVQLGNILVQQYDGIRYNNLATLTTKGDVTANIPGTPASSISFRSDHVSKPIRIGEIKLTGTYRNPCVSQPGGVCNILLMSNAPTVVPVAFTQNNAVALLGDVNGDGKVLASDALMALRRAVGQTVSGASDIAADVNCDGKIVASDALAILQAAVGSRTLQSCDNAQQAAVAEINVERAGEGDIQIRGLESVGSEYRMSFTAAGDDTSRFIGWIGDCVGTTCALTTAGTQELSAYALFVPTTHAQLSPVEGSLRLRNSDNIPAELHDDLDSLSVFEDPPPDISDPLPPAPEEPDVSDSLPPVVTPPPSTAQTNLYVAGIRLSPPSPQIRKTVDVNATIGNAGRAKTSGTFNATLRIDQGNDGTWDASKVVRLQTLAGGATVPVTFKKAFRPSGPNVRIQVCVDDLALPTTENFGIIRTPEYFPGAVSETTKSDNCNVMLVNAAERGGGPATAILSGILIPMYAGPALLVVVLLGGSYLYVRRRKIDVT